MVKTMGTLIRICELLVDARGELVVNVAVEPGVTVGVP